MADDGSTVNKKMRLSREQRDELWKMPREDLVNRIIRQQQEIDALVAKQTSDTSLDELRETVEKLKLQVAESTRQESLLVMRLAAKEQEVQELLGQISELKQALNPSCAQLQSMLLDPAVNLLFTQMKREMDTCRSQLEQSQKDLAAWKFTPDSQTGKRLMAKCRMLLQENEDLGKSMSSGRLAKLEGDIALQKRLIEEMKSSEKETEEFLGDVDEDLEAMQGTVYLLQQELKDAKDRLQRQQTELDELRATTGLQNTASSGELTASRAVTTNDDSSFSSEHTDSRGLDALRTSKNGHNIVHVKREHVENFDTSHSATVLSSIKVEKMDVDGGSVPTNQHCLNDLRTSSAASTKHSHADSDALSSDIVPKEGGLHNDTAAERCRTASNTDFIANGTDDDKAVAMVTN